MSTASTQKKTRIISAGIAVVLLIAVFVCWASTKPMALEGVKTITIVVNHSNGSTLTETFETTARVLFEALIDHVDIVGVETDFGLFVTTVDGEYFDGSDGTYWALYINEEKAEYGVDAQPIANGDVFCFCPVTA